MLEDIKSIVKEVTGVETLDTPSRLKTVARAKAIYSKLARDLTKHNYKEISHAVGISGGNCFQAHDRYFKLIAEDYTILKDHDNCKKQLLDIIQSKDEEDNSAKVFSNPITDPTKDVSTKNRQDYPLNQSQIELLFHAVSQPNTLFLLRKSGIEVMVSFRNGFVTSSSHKLSEDDLAFIHEEIKVNNKLSA